MKKQINISFEDRIAVYKQLLEHGSVLSRPQKNWLLRKRAAYNAEPRKISEEHIALLDQLIPLLGYDWKAYRMKISTSRKSFSDRYKSIFNKLQKREELNSRDKLWLKDVRSKFRSGSRKLSEIEIHKMDQLILLLGYDWRNNLIKVSKRMPFEYHFSEISKKLKANQTISAKNKKWLWEKRKQYHNQSDTFTKVHRRLLDSIIPLLGYDWKEYEQASAKPKSFNQHFNEVLKKLSDKKKLNTRQKSWLQRQREYLKKQHRLMTNHRIQQLDTLIPMLGYDWKENKTKPRKITSFEEHIDLLKISLKESIPLTRKQKNWLYSQRALYIKQPEKFKIEKIKLLNSLNNDLGYVWNKLQRPPKKKTSYKQHIKEIRKKRRTGENLTKPQLQWLQVQSTSYRKQPNSFDNDRKEALDSLIPILGYDWKTLRKPAPEKRTLSESVAILKKLIEEDKEITQRIESWLFRTKKRYANDPNSFSKKDIDLLNSLNPYLEHKWNHYYVGQQERKSLKQHCEEIKEKIKVGRKPSSQDTKWLLEIRKKYRDRLVTYSKEELKTLNSLTKYLKYDWRLYKKERALDDFLKELLISKKTITPAQTRFLRRRGIRFDNTSSEVSQNTLNKLQTLNEQIGADAELIIDEKKAFNYRIAAIAISLSKEGEIKDAHKKWLRSQKELHSINAFAKNKLRKLNSLSILLDKEWTSV